jgi:hypothetical protein
MNTITTKQHILREQKWLWDECLPMCLTITKRLVEQLGGEIHLHNKSFEKTILPYNFHELHIDWWRSPRATAIVRFS